MLDFVLIDLRFFSVSPNFIGARNDNHKRKELCDEQGRLGIESHPFDREFTRFDAH